jgi:hypothetical protein
VFNLYISERRIEDVTVLDLKGRIRITGRARGLHKSIRSLVEKGKTRILLNLSQVEGKNRGTDKHVDEGDEVAIGQNVYITRPDNFNQLRTLLARLLNEIPIAV